jgi:ABC-2 type transport system ATP-binding protein
VLLHDPKVLVLDEPASGLDPRARIEIRDLLLELRRLGKTILVSSHILSELSDVCTSVGIIEKGRLLVAGPIGQLADMLRSRQLESHGAPPLDLEGEDAAEASDGSAPPDHGRAPGGAVNAETAQHAGEPRRLKIRVLGDAAEAGAALDPTPPIGSIEPATGGWLVIHHHGDDAFVAETVKHLVQRDIAVVAVEPERNELERIFLQVTKGKLQ